MVGRSISPLSSHHSCLWLHGCDCTTEETWERMEVEGGPGPGSVGSAWSRSSWPFVLAVLCAVHTSEILLTQYIIQRPCAGT